MVRLHSIFKKVSQAEFRKKCLEQEEKSKKKKERKNKWIV